MVQRTKKYQNNNDTLYIPYKKLDHIINEYGFTEIEDIRILHCTNNPYAVSMVCILCEGEEYVIPFAMRKGTGIALENGQVYTWEKYRAALIDAWANKIYGPINTQEDADPVSWIWIAVLCVIAAAATVGIGIGIGIGIVNHRKKKTTINTSQSNTDVNSSSPPQ